MANDTLAIGGFYVDNDTKEIEPDNDIFTINLSSGNQIYDELCAFVDTNNNRGIDEWFIEELKVAEQIVLGTSGYCAYPLLRFEQKWLTNLPTLEEVEERMCEINA